MKIRHTVTMLFCYNNTKTIKWPHQLLLQWFNYLLRSKIQLALRFFFKRISSILIQSLFQNIYSNRQNLGICWTTIMTCNCSYRQNCQDILCMAIWSILTLFTIFFPHLCQAIIFTAWSTGWPKKSTPVWFSIT